MSYTIKEQPKKIYESVTFELTVNNENDVDYKIRKWEDNNGGGFYIYDSTTNEWVDFYPPEDLDDFLDYNVDY